MNFGKLKQVASNLVDCTKGLPYMRVAEFGLYIYLVYWLALRLQTATGASTSEGLGGPDTAFDTTEFTVQIVLLFTGIAIRTSWLLSASFRANLLRHRQIVGIAALCAFGTLLLYIWKEAPPLDLREPFSLRGIVSFGLYSLSATAAVLCARSLARCIRGTVGEADVINTPHERAVDSVIVQLRKRARFSRGLSGVALILIALSILGGISIFVVAARVSPTISLARSQGIFDVQRNLQDVRTALRKMSIFGYKQYAESYRSELLNALGIRTSGNMSLNLDDATREASVRQELENLAKEYQTQIDAAEGANAPQLDSKENLYFFASTTVTRVGVVLLLLFLVRILLDLYRYSIRIAAFYDARADSIQASKDDSALDLQKYLAVFNADSVAFEKSIEMPYEKIVELAKVLLERSGGTGQVH